jgi:hypothetical protein
MLVIAATDVSLRPSSRCRPNTVAACAAEEEKREARETSVSGSTSPGFKKGRGSEAFLARRVGRDTLVDVRPETKVKLVPVSWRTWGTQGRKGNGNRSG